MFGRYLYCEQHKGEDALAIASKCLNKFSLSIKENNFFSTQIAQGNEH